MVKHRLRMIGGIHMYTIS